MTNDFLIGSQEQMVGGMYRLGAAIDRSAGGAVYETEWGDDARPAVVKLRRGDEPDSERLVARWRNAIEFAHPNLLRVYAAGFSAVDDVPVVYVVMERADESLGGVLAERALSEAETREMLAPALAALRYLHKNGYAHSSLKPSNTLAVGDLLKLSSDSALPVGAGGKPAEDIRALGAVIVQALTRQFPNIDENSGPPDLREFSGPFADIVRHCLDPDPDKRWTVDQVEARLNAPLAASVSQPPPRVAGEFVVKEEARRVAVPPANELRAARAEYRDADVRSRRTPRWIYAALAALVLIVVLVGFWRKQYSGPAPTAQAQPAIQAAPALPLSSPDTPGPEAKDPQLAANPAPPAELNPVDPGARSGREEGWSVIVGTYGFREPAEKRVEEIARKWPTFKSSVFEQHADKTYYLIVIGQNLSEDAAEALRKRATASGLPRDTYIKKLQPAP